MPNFNQYHTDNGIIYPNLQVLELYNNDLLSLGKLITKTNNGIIFTRRKSLINDPDIGKDKGVIIYQSFIDENIGYRIDINYNNPYFSYQSQLMAINELQKLQPSIKLTQFPYGIVIKNNKPIGEIIPFYPNSINILEYFKKINDKQIICLYKKLLEILQEMYDNGILYYDINEGNFLVTINNNYPVIHTIDFDRMFLCFKEYSSDYKNRMIDNMYRFLYTIKKTLNDTKNESELFHLTNDFVTKVIKK